MTASPHVLVVDDEEAIRTIARLALEHVGGCQVTCASDAFEALAILEELRPDCILLDNMMPAMTGPEMAEILGADPVRSTIPIVFLTARISAADRQCYDDLGAAGLIAKPFDPMTLADEVRSLLAARVDAS